MPAPAVTRRIDLMGNHEAMLLDALAAAETEPGAAAIELWLVNGGAASLASWGVPAESPAAEWAERIPPASSRASARSRSPSGGRLSLRACRHPARRRARAAEPAGHAVDPRALPLHAGPFGAVVVHGHTPVRAPVLRPNRIGIDTGAVFGGALTCLVLEENRLGFLVA